MSTNRRGFLHTALTSTLVAGHFERLRANLNAGSLKVRESYGPLLPAKDATTGLPLIHLPDGFRYLTFGWRGDAMEHGRTPAVHDGMGVIASTNGRIVLCRNHEVTNPGRPIDARRPVYDPQGAGGCTNLEFDTKEEKLVRTWGSLSGTIRNCAGGVTPWGTWLSCEETSASAGDSVKDRPGKYERDHGYVFEVPADTHSDAVPLKAMGRFVHEAVCVDPASGCVYETEDRDTAGFYRFTPKIKGRLAAGGRLEMMKLDGLNDTRKGVAVGKKHDVRWVPIDDPLRLHSPGSKDGLGVFWQGSQRGGAVFARLEGVSHFDGKIFITATSGGTAKCGQVWQYAPRDETLTLLFESPNRQLLDMPDNMTISPAGGILLCEDGSHDPQRLQILTEDGSVVPFAANQIKLSGERNGIRGKFSQQEWAGATFSPDGKWLFVNIQTPGLTLAITGPWKSGHLS